MYEEVFRHRNFRGHFRVVVVLCFKNHTYNYTVNCQRALISSKLERRTIILGHREYYSIQCGSSFLDDAWSKKDKFVEVSFLS